MEKLKMQSTDKVQYNIEKIREMFPNAVTEVKRGEKTELAVDFDVLKQELADTLIDERELRYQFTWPDKQKSILLANTPVTATLRPDKEKSVDFDNTQNLYIEGDNLDVLKLLRETYLGKIRVIYIDPPYNTGNDFVYEDDFAQSAEKYAERNGEHDEAGNRLFQNTESNGRFHTDWLNMIYPRLKVAKDLLSDDGVILINMDENEITNLQKICNEVFGEANDLGTIIWDKRNPKGDARGISQQHEYIIVFCRQKDKFLQKNSVTRPKKNAKLMLKKASELFSKRSNNYTLDKINKDFQQWLINQPNISGGERAYNRIDEEGNLYQAVSMAWPNKKQAPQDYYYVLTHPITHKPCPVPSMGWRNPSKTMIDLYDRKLILFGEDETTQPRKKYLLKDNMSENIPSLLYYGGSDVDLLNELGIPFETPKVVNIVMEHIKSFSNKDSIILDFFSGSATTAHAVMQLNAEDGGHRKFIMVQLPELCDEKSEAYKAGYKTICDIGEERIRRAGQKIKAELEKPKQQSIYQGDSSTALRSAQNDAGAQLDIGFRVLRLDSSNMREVYYHPEQYTQTLLDDLTDNIKEDRTPLDLLFQVMLDLGVKPSAKIEEKEIAGKRVFVVNENELIACFDDEITDEVVKAIAKMQPLYAAFRDSSLASDSVAANFDQIFATYSPSTKKEVL